MEETLKPRTYDQIMASRKEKARQAQRKREEVLIEFVEDRLIGEAEPKPNCRLKFAIPVDEFPACVRGCERPFVNFVNDVFSRSGWFVDQSMDQEGNERLEFCRRG